jgi:DNA-binding NarL/FixJ family response regulator
MSRKRRLRDSRDMQHTVPPTRVFLADDSALSRRRVAEMLTAQGMVVAGEANTPESAVSGILATQPDVVVLDVQFEKGTGMQVLQSVLKATQDIPFIILSNHAEAAYRVRYLAAGAACFLDKHAEFYQLGGAVDGLAQSRRVGHTHSFS